MPRYMIFSAKKKQIRNKHGIASLRAKNIISHGYVRYCESQQEMVGVKQIAHSLSNIRVQETGFF